MALSEDQLSRLSRGRGAADTAGRRWLSLAVAVFVAFVLLLLSRLEHPLTQALRWRVNDTLSPVISAIVQPVGPLRAWVDRLAALSGAEAEVERLKAENAELLRHRSRAAELERRVAELASLANLVREPAVSHVTARVLAASVGPQSETVVVAAGHQQGVRLGHPALSGDGVVGRVIETGAQVARVLLLNDPASRLPVRIGGGASHAVLTGDAGRLPRLEYLTDDNGVGPGDEVVTSGIGGMFPRGLRVGVVERDGATLRVKPYARLGRLEYLSILAYDNPALGLVEETVPAKLAQRRAPAPAQQQSEGR